MSYSTHLYAVDLDALRAAIGSKDSALWERLARSEEGDIDEPSEVDVAVRRLIFGVDPGQTEFEGFRESNDAHALRELCGVIGTWLDDDDSLGDLEPLELDSPLCVERMPVDLPQPRDFPSVRYLEADEVAAEVKRLETMDLSFEDDSDIEYARKMLFECLREADKMGRAVVAFYG